MIRFRRVMAIMNPVHRFQSKLLSRIPIVFCRRCPRSSFVPSHSLFLGSEFLKILIWFSHMKLQKCSFMYLCTCIIELPLKKLLWVRRCSLKKKKNNSLFSVSCALRCSSVPEAFNIFLMWLLVLTFRLLLCVNDLPHLFSLHMFWERKKKFKAFENRMLGSHLQSNFFHMEMIPRKFPHGPRMIEQLYDFDDVATSERIY